MLKVIINMHEYDNNHNKGINFEKLLFGWKEINFKFLFILSITVFDIPVV
jgi:hypothetical protein